MNIWIVKNIRFGCKYTSDKNIRNQILNSIKWLIDNIKQKSKESDIFILSGGLFYNTNPSIIAINDAFNFINELKKYINVYLVNTSKDTRLFDNVYYSTLDIFNNVNIVKDILKINDITIVPFQYNYNDNLCIQCELGKFNNEDIPNLMQIDENEDKPGILIYNTEKNKHIFLENKVSPKHYKHIINTIDELINLSKNNNENINNHLIINKILLNDYKTDIDILIHKINPTSIKYTNDTINYDKINIIDITTNLSIDDTIIEHIKDNDNLIKQFNRVKQIMTTKNNIEI